MNSFKADMQAASKAAVDAAQKTETAWDKSNTRTGNAMKQITRYSSELTTAGTAMATFGGVVVGALGLSAKAAMSWESAFAGVLKTVDGSPRQLAKVEEGLRGLTKVLPASHEEIAAVAEAAGQLGIKTENVVSFTKTMIDMGESTNLSAEDAATSLARLSNIMGTSQNDFGKMGASIVGLGNNFATTEREIVEMSMRIAGVGKQAGLTEGDVFGLATALSSVGIDAEAGGTAISMVMKKIGNEVAGGGDKVAEFARIAGMSSDDFSAAWRDDAGGALNSFIQGLGNAQAQGENVNGTLTNLGITGIRESDALLRLSASGDVLSDALKTGNDEFERGTALAQEAAKRYETADSKIKMAGNSLKDTAITIGGTFLPAIAGVAQALAGVASWFGDLPEPVLRFGAAIGGVVGTLALAAGGFLVLAPRIVETITAVNTLRNSSTTLDKTLSAIGGGGKTATALRNIGKAAGIAAGAWVGLQLAAAAYNAISTKPAVQGVEDITNALIKAAQQSGHTNTELDKLFQAKDGGKLAGNVRDLDSAIESVMYKGDPFNKFINESLGGDAINKALGTTSKARDQFYELDEAVANLASSGNGELAAETFSKVADSFEAQGYSVKDAAALFPEYEKALMGVANEAGVAVTEQEKLAWMASGELPPALASVSGASDAVAEAVSGMGDKADSTKEKLAALADEIRGFGSETLSAREAARQVEAGWDDLTEAIKSGKTSLDDSTEAGRKNNELLDAQIRNINEETAANIERGDSVASVTKKHKANRDEMIRMATAFFGSEKKAKAYVDQVLKTPKQIKTDIKLNSEGAVSKLKTTKEWMDKIKDKTVWVKVNEVYVRKEGDQTKYKTSRHGSTFEAAGSIMEFYAGGGLRPMDPVAKMVHPNTWRVVGDRSDVDEAYIPLDGSRRSMAILGEAMKRMPGLDLMASGGVVSAQSRVDSASDSLKNARRAKQDAKSSKAKAAATRRVRAAEDELAAAKKSLKAAKAKAAADEKAAKLAAKEAKEAAEAAAKKKKEEQERRARVGELQSDLRTDVRRGTIRDSVTSGLSGGLSQVDELFSLGSNEDLSKASRSKANSSARKFEASLTKLYAKAEKLDEKLKAAQDKATELQGISDSVSSSLLNGRGVDVGDYQNFENGQWSTYSGVSGATRRLTADVGAMKAFAGKLKKLAAKGIPGAIIQEIAQAGVEEGSTMADAFLDASDAEVQSYVGAWNDYEKYANAAGQYVTEGFYDGGLNAANGVVKGLESQQSNVEKAIANLAKSMEATFKSVLGIHSPSRVMAELGGFTAEGLVQGMLGGVADVESAADELGLAAIPTTGVSVDVSTGDAPVTDSDEGLASTALQDMSATTLEAMAAMGLAVSDGFAGMLANVQLTQAGMLLATQESNLGQLTDTQLQQAAMLLNTQTQNAAMLLDTQTQQEEMRSTVARKQAGQRTAAEEQQESMRLMLIDKQDQMKKKSAEDFESLKKTTGLKFGDMRTATDTTMSNIYGDYDSRLGDLKGLNSRGFESILKTSNANMEAVRDGIDGEMSAAKPEMGNRLNSLIGVLSKFTASVNKAFGDVGVKLKSPQAIKFASGGVMPGYSPGADIHRFVSPTAGELHLSGGEAIMRPEWTRAMGGERGVKAQNDAARQGRFDDLLHMQESGHFATGGVYGRVPGVNAFADSGVWRNLWAITKAKFPNATLNSAYRGGSITASGNTSHHARGNAIDVNPSMDIFNFWRNKYGANLAELIYSPAGNKQIKNGSNYTYTGAVKSMHYNHVHIAALQALSDAMAGGLPGMGGEMSHPFLDRAKVSAGTDLEASYKKAAEKLTADIYGKYSKLLPSGEFGQLGKGIMSQVSEGLVKKAVEYGKNAGSADFSNVASGPVKTMAKDMLKQMGWEDQFGDLNWLLTRESGWNPKAQNPTSTAYGLFQFLNSTWGSVGGSKTSDPRKQLEYGLKYIQQRYGDVKGARSFWERNHWYANGTESAQSGWALVGEQGPEAIRLNGGEQIKNAADTRRLVSADNRTFIPNTRSGGGLDYDALAKAVVSNLPPSLVVNNDNAGLIEERIAKKTVQEFADKQALYTMGV
ncbi:phage tail tape measure protein [Brevibacterium oceani]|uniref:phage tail tape measure protein n=1 Tax=Brevibacterium oceani TaxID=358099 RepID=UPI0015E78851|nr:phage tail tape measure protein [Brevibacterium oceani]